MAKNQNTADAIKVIADAASEASKVIANAAAEALKVKDEKTDGDHDLLIRLEENVGINFSQVKDAIQKLSDGTSTQIADHELRINSLETSNTRLVVMLGIGIAILSTLVGLLIYHIIH